MKGYKKLVALGLTAFLIANDAFGMGQAVSVNAEETGNMAEDSGSAVENSGSAAENSGNGADASGSGSGGVESETDISGSDSEGAETDGEGTGSESEEPGADGEGSGSESGEPGTDGEDSGTDGEGTGSDAEGSETDGEGTGSESEGSETDGEESGDESEGSETDGEGIGNDADDSETDGEESGDDAEDSETDGEGTGSESEEPETEADGTVEEGKISGREAVSESGILPMDLPGDLIGYYTFDNTLANSAGSGAASIHGGAGDTWNNPATGQAAYGVGKNGQAYSFTGDSGTEESLVRGEGLQLDVKMPAEYTISYWVNPDTVSFATSMVFSPIDSGNGLNIADNWGGATFPTVRIWGLLAATEDCYMDNGIESADELCGQWTYITLTGDAAGNNVLYINGEQKATGSSIAGAFEGMDIFLGINFWDTSFDGLMDDVAIYSRALSAAEVSALYQNNGVPEGGDFVPEAPYLEHVSVHDPSIVKDEATGMYYVFGSHRAWARSRDLLTWQTFSNNLSDVEECSRIFANEIAWAAMGDSTYNVTGNMWAPDVIWNEQMGKWCMYMSINGCSWNSSICLLTADSLDGDWTYVGPVVYSGFTSEAVHDFTKTDYSKVTGETVLDARYAMNAYTCIGNDGKTSTEPTTWNTNYGAHAIDPCIVVADDGTWYMSYGSWSGGIYMIQLDKATGLRDYNVSYAYEANRSDPYMGYKIAGGNFVSGEASYIQKMGDYYYLYVTLGGLTSTGGYNMRVFRSESITGPYVDYSGDDARSQTGSYNSSVGNRVMSGYKWSFMQKGYVAQGHNSVMVDTDGRMYLFNHYRFNDGTESHEMRVHQVFINEDGWLVTAPFEYKGESLSADVTKEAVAGTYEVLFHRLEIDYENLEVVTGETFSLNADGTVTSNRTGSWQSVGTWDFSEKGAPYVTVTIGDTVYKGVFVEQRMEGLDSTTWCFTLLGSDEISAWGYKVLGNDQDMVESAIANLSMPEGTFVDLALPTIAGAATISWESSNPAVLASDGKVTAPATDTTVTLTATFQLNTTFIQKEYQVKVYAPQTSTESKVLATYFTDEKVDLTGAMVGTYQYANPFYDGTTKGLQIYNGISIKFDLEATAGADQWLRNIIGFNAGNVGGLYFTGNSYLGYNATGGFFDANIKNGDFADMSWQWGTDFLKDSAAVEIRILPTGFEVYVNGALAYDQDSVETYESGKTEYTVPGSASISLYSHVLGYLQSSASYLNFGWGSWWEGGYYGTISNVVLSVLPVDDMEASGETVGTWNVNTPGTLAWNDYSNFFGLKGTGDFTLNWRFKNYNPGDYNWRNFAIAVTTDMDRTLESAEDWYLRADVYSNAVFGGGNEKVAYEFDWSWDDYIPMMNGAEIDATLERSGTVMTFTAVIIGSDGKTYHYKAVVAEAPTEDVMVYLGGENCYLVISDYTGKDLPFIEGESGKIGWEAVKAETEAAPDGEQVSVNMNGTTKVPGDVVESVKGKDVILALDMGNGIVWLIDGMKVNADKVGDVDFAVEFTDRIPPALVGAVAGNRQTKQFSIAHEGDFGYTAVMQIDVDKANAGKYANLYYHNKDKEKLEYVCRDLVSEDGIAELTFTHASSYVIVLSETTMGGGSGGTNSGGNTGGTTSDGSTGGTTSGGNSGTASDYSAASQAMAVLSPKTGEEGAFGLGMEDVGNLGRILLAGAVALAMAGLVESLIRQKAEKRR